MQCFKPVKLYLSDESREKRISCEYMPNEWRFATEIYVPCGKCSACLSNRKSEWIYRLTKEYENSLSAYFITLTYDDENLPRKNVILDDCIEEINPVVKKDVQNFLKRLRFNIQPFKIRYFAISEYGPRTFRPHYHMIVFNFPHELKNKLLNIIENSWQNGFVSVDSVNPARIAYVCSYCLDHSSLPSHFVPNFMLCSRRPGIGSSYIDNDRIRAYHVNNLVGYCTNMANGQAYKVRMPRYYRDKLFDCEQSNKISHANDELHVRAREQINRKQRIWLRKHKKRCTAVNLQTPFPGSPRELELQSIKEFEERVKKSCKMKGNF
jgi:hypothetical protein